LAAGLGPPPDHQDTIGAWNERHHARAEFLAGLADWDPTQLRRAALTLVDDLDVSAQQMLIDAAHHCSD
jgi:hypothetical protein